MTDDSSPLARPHGKRRRPRRRWALPLASIVASLLLLTAIAARLTFTLIPPHRVFPPSAVLSAEKAAQLDAALEIDRPLDRDQAIDFALEYTGESLSFSRGHQASFEFGTATRKASCAEYAALFVAVFDAAAKKAGSTARALRLRSDVQVFSRRVPLSSFADHDWVLVRDPADGARLYLDPTLADVWLGSSLAHNVKGGAEIALPE